MFQQKPTDMDTFKQFTPVTDLKELDKLNVLDQNNDYQFLTKEQAKMSQLKLKREFLKIKIEELTESIKLLKEIHSPKNAKKN